MANRAYLFSRDIADAGDDIGPQPSLDRSTGSTPYYDSRHSLPWAWWFLCPPSAPRLVEVEIGDKPYLYPTLWLVALKEPALARFARHMPLMREIAGSRFSVDKTLGKFAADLARRPGNTLIVDTFEVLQGDEEEEAEQCRHTLNLIDAGASIEAIKAAIGWRSCFEYKDQDEFELRVTGYTYWQAGVRQW